MYRRGGLKRLLVDTTPRASLRHLLPSTEGIFVARRRFSPRALERHAHYLVPCICITPRPHAVSPLMKQGTRSSNPPTPPPSPPTPLIPPDRQRIKKLRRRAKEPCTNHAAFGADSAAVTASEVPSPAAGVAAAGAAGGAASFTGAAAGAGAVSPAGAATGSFTGAAAGAGAASAAGAAAGSFTGAAAGAGAASAAAGTVDEGAGTGAAAAGATSAAGCTIVDGDRSKAATTAAGEGKVGFLVTLSANVPDVKRGTCHARLS